jgi:hypothetical protein
LVYVSEILGIRATPTKAEAGLASGCCPIVPVRRYLVGVVVEKRVVIRRVVSLGRSRGARPIRVFVEAEAMQQAQKLLSVHDGSRTAHRLVAFGTQLGVDSPGS